MYTPEAGVRTLPKGSFTPLVIALQNYENASVPFQGAALAHLVPRPDGEVYKLNLSLFRNSAILNL